MIKNFVEQATRPIYDSLGLEKENVAAIFSG
jgi:hypothetical protein